MKMLPQTLRHAIRKDVFYRLFGPDAQRNLSTKIDALFHRIHVEEQSLTVKKWITHTTLIIGPSPTDTINLTSYRLPVPEPGYVSLDKVTDPDVLKRHQVLDANLIKEGRQLLTEVAMFRRRYQSAESFLNRLMAQCSHSSQFHQYHVKAYKDAGLYNSAVYGWVDSLTEKHREVFKVNEYHEVPEERIQEFMAQEKEAIDALNNHVFLTKLIG